MKKIAMTLLLSVTLLVAGCSDKVVNESDMSQEQLLEEIFNGISGYESIQSDIFLDQLIEPENELEHRRKTEIVTKLTRNPFTMHQTVAMDLGGGEEGLMEDESYMVGDGIYSKVTEDAEGNPMEGWAHIPYDVEEVGAQKEVIADFRPLIEISEKISVEEKGDDYLLTVLTSAKEDQDFINQMAATNIGDFIPLDYAEEIDGEQVNIELVVDQKTKQLKEYVLDTKATVVFQDGVEKITQRVENKLSNMNELEPIQIPKEVTEQVIEMD